jgi:S1-C subfamily serine protease
MKVRYSAVAALLLGASVAWAQSGGGGGGAGGSGGSGSGSGSSAGSGGTGGSGASGAATGNAGSSTQAAPNQPNSTQNDNISSSNASQSLGNQNQPSQNEANQNRGLRSESVDQSATGRSGLSNSETQPRSAADRSDNTRFRDRDLTDERRRELRTGSGGRSARNRDQNWRDRDDSDQHAWGDSSSERNRRAYSSDRDAGDTRERNRRIGISFSDSGDALVISRINGSGLAARVGLRRGDEIVSFDGRRVNSAAQFMRWVNDWTGSRAPLVVWRDGERQTLYWNGGSSGYDSNQVSWNDADDDSSSSNRPRGGFAGVLLDTDYDYAAVVRQVYRDSPAARAGIRAGDTILAINGRPVSSADEVSDTLSELDPGTPVEIQVAHASPRRVELRLSSRGGESVASRNSREDDDRDDRRDESYDDRDE